MPSMSLKLRVTASAATRTSPGPGARTSTSSRRRTSPGRPCSLTRHARETAAFMATPYAPGMGRLILTNATVLDGENPAVTGRTVVIDGDRIQSVSAAPPSPAADDEVVDLGGRTVMPGMVTCHFHSTYHELGSTTAPYGNEYPPAYQALLSARNLMTALRWGYTGAVGAGGSNDI